MKKINKKIIAGIIIGAIVGSISVHAVTTHYQSEQILYTKNGTEMTTTTFLDNIYSLLPKGNATAGDIISGKTAIVKGKKVVGTASEIDFLSVSGSTLDQSSINQHFDIDNKTNNQNYDIYLTNFSQVSNICHNITQDNIVIEIDDVGTTAYNQSGTVTYSYTYTPSNCLLRVNVRVTNWASPGKQTFVIKVFTLNQG